MLPLTNQFPDLFECVSVIGNKKYFCARLEASICRAAFVIFLYEGVYLCPITDKHSDESWKWFVEISIPGALS